MAARFGTAGISGDERDEAAGFSHESAMEDDTETCENWLPSSVPLLNPVDAHDSMTSGEETEAKEEMDSETIVAAASA